MIMTITALVVMKGIVIAMNEANAAHKEFTCSIQGSSMSDEKQ